MQQGFHDAVSLEAPAVWKRGFGFGALAGCAPQADQGGSSTSAAWDQEVDLLVCGAGGCGLACAVEAKDNGAENVLVIEKGDMIGGTTAMSQG